MPGTHNFEHLPLVVSYEGRARLRGGGRAHAQTEANRHARPAHSSSLESAAQSLISTWQERQEKRSEQSLPVIQNSVPILLKVDPGLDLDDLREKFAFEIVAEQEEGFVIVASEEIDMASFLAMVDNFAHNIRGSATIASIHQLFADPTQEDRLSRVLSDGFLNSWNNIADDQEYIADVGVACVGTQEIPSAPIRGKRDRVDADWEAKLRAWSQKRNAAYDQWDALKIEREDQIERFRRFYNGEILRNTDDADFEAGVLPDSFTVRIKISGKGLKDLILNNPYIFEVVEPEDIDHPQGFDTRTGTATQLISPTPPHHDAPAVCIIDSGIQEGHVLLQPAIDSDASHCFIPGMAVGAIADEVAPGGHGTRVAGAVLYGEDVPQTGGTELPFWIQNARVLDAQCSMPVRLFPPEAIRQVVERFNSGERRTRIFNHSINARGYCRIRYMSAWAAEIDQLCFERDVLLVQSVGNLATECVAPFLGIREHLVAGRSYPSYLHEASARIANPGQSLQAVTVGSIAYNTVNTGTWRTFAVEPHGPSAFSRTGPGIWNVIKPELVMHGGDAIHTSNTPPDVMGGGRIPEACPHLVRSTLHAPGPASDRDDVGTSYAAPKVARIVAQIQQVLPNEPALLYRALVVQSAQWPEWAEAFLTGLRNPPASQSFEEQQSLRSSASRALRCLGFGIPDDRRATVNTEYRTTFITSDVSRIRAAECHIYTVPIPPELRQQADDFDIRIDITLSYVAQPRRTRRNLRRYLSTWVDWKTSNLGESLDHFKVRALRDSSVDEEPLSGSTLPWTLHEKPNWGIIRDYKRNSGTVQKDWAVIRSNKLPDHFCIAVVGHKGWSKDPDSYARYALAVTFDIQGGEIGIYEPLRTAIVELQAGTVSVIENIEVEIAE